MPAFSELHRATTFLSLCTHVCLAGAHTLDCMPLLALGTEFAGAAAAAAAVS